jgi:hypothetical protein
MLLSRKKREPSNVSKARHGAARGLEKAASAVDVEIDESKPKRRRKPLVLVALAALGAWLVAKSRRSDAGSDPSDAAADVTQKTADKVSKAATGTAEKADKVSSSTGNSAR